MNYDKHAQSGSMLNIPTFAWYMAGKVLNGLNLLGGLDAVKERNYLSVNMYGLLIGVISTATVAKNNNQL